MPTVKYITNGNWVAIPTSGAIATDTTYGYVKLATQADISAGTSNSAVVTAKQFKDFADGNFVHLTGDETIAGNKTFTKNVVTQDAKPVQKYTTSSSAEEYTLDNARALRSNGSNWFFVGAQKNKSTGNYYQRMGIWNDANTDFAAINVGWTPSGSKFTDAPTPAASNVTSGNTNITTVEWVNDPAKSTNVVHRSGDETVAGTKTFSNNPILSINSTNSRYKCKDLGYAQGDTPSSNRYSGIDIYDKNNVEMGTFFTTFQTDGSVRSSVWVKSPVAGSTSSSAISITINSSGTISTSAPTPPAGNNSTQIATTAWCYDPTKSTNLVHRTGDETIGGTKTFSNTIQGTAYRALWGDLAEYYLTDQEYPKGTLVQFGGEKEITIAKNKVNAVITSEPGFILNSNMENSQAIALIGRVPVRVIGKVNKFDKIALSYIDGIGCVNNDTENPIGIALESKADADESLIICSVKIDLV